MQEADEFALVYVGQTEQDMLSVSVELQSAIESAGGKSTALRTLGRTAREALFRAETSSAVRLRAHLSQRSRGALDWAVLPATNRKKRLLISDMDSTIIGQECLDELADYAGLKTEISAITERAMRGELNFEAALTERVAMLEGLDLAAIDSCYRDRIRLNEGAETLVATMTAHGARCILVSGGFTAFTECVGKAAGFVADFANVLLDDGKSLTGKVQTPILGREAKLETLNREAASLGIDPADTLALGDGANDLAMIKASGLGVAYRAKPIVAAEADCAINHTSLRTALYFQGYTDEEIVGP